MSAVNPLISNRRMHRAVEHTRTLGIAGAVGGAAAFTICAVGAMISAYLIHDPAVATKYINALGKIALVISGSTLLAVIANHSLYMRRSKKLSNPTTEVEL